jgi:NAD(P)-dependent dehydrogenase (short-subunit alcohol dehydrogenase family)
LGESVEATGASIYERLFDVRGTRAVVTGAASGIGAAMAEVLVEAGAQVVLADRDVSGLEERVAALTRDGGHAEGVVADVSIADDVERLFGEVASRFGGVDVVFANAGIAGGRGYAKDEGGTLAALDLEIFDEVVRVNLRGVLLTMRAAARLMVPKRSGKIVVTASTAGLRADPMVGYPYIATKGGVVNVVRQAALELGRHQVTVNAIVPGPTKTNIGGKPHDEAAIEEWSRTLPLGRMASTDEMKGLVLLLASKASSFMTGALIPIDGGSLVAAPAM